MFGLGFGEVVLVLIIALVFIGPKKLPELAKSLGKGLREFQNAAKGFQDQMTKEAEDLKPKIDMDDVKKEIADGDSDANNSGHGNWDPYPDQAKIPDTEPSEPVTSPKKDENQA